jgi:hypothetical protein
MVEKNKNSIPIFFSLQMKVKLFFSYNISYFSKYHLIENFFFSDSEVFNIEERGKSDYYQFSQPHPMSLKMITICLLSLDSVKVNPILLYVSQFCTIFILCLS